jgi:hypothetical protein
MKKRLRVCGKGSQVFPLPWKTFGQKNLLARLQGKSETFSVRDQRADDIAFQRAFEAKLQKAGVVKFARFNKDSRWGIITSFVSH